MIVQHRITVFSRDPSLSATLVIRLQSRGYQVLAQNNPVTLLGIVYSDPPDIIIIDLSALDREIITLIAQLKGDSYFSAVPVLGLINGSDADSFPWNEVLMDDFIFLPVKFTELFARISLSISRIQRVFDNNPLTRLPGNTSIQQAITRVIGTPMAVCHIDINNFKPYNDIFGFSRGDEVLRMLARIMFNAVKESGGGFSGHIGGDDFVFIVPMERAETVCSTIIENFTAVSLDLFDDRDKQNGYYLGKNRKGQEERFPLLSIAIAIVPTDTPKIDHFGRVAEMAAELKNLAKKSGKNCFVVDRRQR